MVDACLEASLLTLQGDAERRAAAAAHDAEQLRLGLARSESQARCESILAESEDFLVRQVFEHCLVPFQTGALCGAAHGGRCLRGSPPAPPPRGADSPHTRPGSALGDVRVRYYFLFTYSSCRINSSLIFDCIVCVRGVVLRGGGEGQEWCSGGARRWRAMWCEKLVAGAGMSRRARRSLRGAERGAKSVPRPVI